MNVLGSKRAITVAALVAAAPVGGCGKLLGVDDYDTQGSGPCATNYVTASNGTGCVYDVNSLSELLPSEGTLVPAFDPEVTEYVLFVDVLTRQVRFRPTVADGLLTTVRVNGQVVASGVDSQAINLTVGVQSLSVEVTAESGRTATYTVTVERGYFAGYVKATNTDGGDAFGTSVDVDGDLLVVGAPTEDSSGTSPANSPTHTDSGAVYVYRRDAFGVFANEAVLKAEDVRAGDNFGASVAISGTTVVVGAPLANNGAEADSGAAYVFVRDGTGTWTQEARVRAGNYGAQDDFGRTVDISGDLMAVGAPLEDSDATQIDGDGTSNEAASAGAVYVFSRSAGIWTQSAYLKAHDASEGDTFGTAVAMTSTRVVVGAPGSDASNTGPASGSPATDDGVTDAGAVYVFELDVGWSQLAYLKPGVAGASDAFGASVAVEGDRVLVGAPGEDSALVIGAADPNNDGAPDSGAAYYFVYVTGSFGPGEFVKASNAEPSDAFGRAVGIETVGTDVALLVSAPLEDGGASLLGATGTTNGSLDAGAAYLFRATSSGVLQTAYIKASATFAEAHFGNAIALGGGQIAIGCAADASAATGVGGDATDRTAPAAGAAFLYF